MKWWLLLELGARPDAVVLNEWQSVLQDVTWVMDNMAEETPESSELSTDPKPASKKPCLSK
ncbi:hypothetical protein VKT23_016618 [Stygiomarasmius scandens]|uniref:Uncharacterized protein n=1 Tax=Marasmiellus scandens TaxID=2682957 RepID=A0ABR1IYU2_9AGAR